MFIGARGGAGGKGNYFYLSNSNRAPMEVGSSAILSSKIMNFMKF